MSEIICFAFGIGILLADQWSKRTILGRGANRHPGWGGVVRFKFAPHRHKSFERSSSRAAFVITWILALACAAILHRFGAKFQSASALAGLGLALAKPVLGIHHLEGHLLSPLLAEPRPKFPFVALLVSGGHTQLMAVEAVGRYILLGETVDDAAGEAQSNSTPRS